MMQRSVWSPATENEHLSCKKPFHRDARMYLQRRNVLSQSRYSLAKLDEYFTVELVEKPVVET